MVLKNLPKNTVINSSTAAQRIITGSGTETVSATSLPEVIRSSKNFQTEVLRLCHCHPLQMTVFLSPPPLLLWEAYPSPVTTKACLSLLWQTTSLYASLSPSCCRSACWALSRACRPHGVGGCALCAAAQNTRRWSALGRQGSPAVISAPALAATDGWRRCAESWGGRFSQKLSQLTPLKQANPSYFLPCSVESAVS